MKKRLAVFAVCIGILSVAGCSTADKFEIPDWVKEAETITICRIPTETIDELEFNTVVRGEFLYGYDINHASHELTFRVNEVYGGNITADSEITIQSLVGDVIYQHQEPVLLTDEDTPYRAGEEYLLLVRTEPDEHTLVGYGQHITFNDVASGNMYADEQLSEYIPEFDFTQGTDAFIEFLLARIDADLSGVEQA